MARQSVFDYLHTWNWESEREREGERWLPFYVWVWEKQDRDQPQMAAVRGLGGRQRHAIHPSPRCRHSIIQALWTWIKCHPTPDCLSTSTLSCWHWPLRPKRRLESISHVESQSGLSRSWRINKPELKVSCGIDECSEEGDLWLRDLQLL